MTTRRAPSACESNCDSRTTNASITRGYATIGARSRLDVRRMADEVRSMRAEDGRHGPRTGRIRRVVPEGRPDRPFPDRMNFAGLAPGVAAPDHTRLANGG